MGELLYEVRNHIAMISIDRPKALNALNRSVVRELEEKIEQLRNDQEIRALILKSNQHFAAGADIRSMVNCSVEEARQFSFSAAFQTLADLPIPTIAAMDGYALGGGLELALACDFRIAAATAKMGFPEINLGIMPGAGGTVRAPRLVGEAKAKELIFLGEIITAEKALHIGLVNQVVERDRLAETALRWAEQLSHQAPVALKAAKKAVASGMAEKNLLSALKIEEEYWTRLFATEDQKEGMTAFLEKRRPVYQGK